MELHSKSIPEPKSVVYEIPFVDGSKDTKMEDPAYQSTIPFVDGSKDVKMEDPAYQNTIPFVDGSKDLKMEDPAYQSTIPLMQRYKTGGQPCIYQNTN